MGQNLSRHYFQRSNIRQNAEIENGRQETRTPHQIVTINGFNFYPIDYHEALRRLQLIRSINTIRDPNFLRNMLNSNEDNFNMNDFLLNIIQYCRSAGLSEQQQNLIYMVLSNSSLIMFSLQESHQHQPIDPPIAPATPMPTTTPVLLSAFTPPPLVEPILVPVCVPISTPYSLSIPSYSPLHNLAPLMIPTILQQVSVNPIAENAYAVQPICSMPFQQLFDFDDSILYNQANAATTFLYQYQESRYQIQNIYDNFTRQIDCSQIIYNYSSNYEDAINTCVQAPMKVLRAILDAGESLSRVQSVDTSNYEMIKKNLIELINDETAEQNAAAMLPTVEEPRDIFTIDENEYLLIENCIRIEKNLMEIMDMSPLTTMIEATQAGNKTASVVGNQTSSMYDTGGTYNPYKHCSECNNSNIYPDNFVRNASGSSPMTFMNAVTALQSSTSLFCTEYPPSYIKEIQTAMFPEDYLKWQDYDCNEYTKKQPNVFMASTSQDTFLESFVKNQSMNNDESHMDVLNALFKPGANKKNKNKKQNNNYSLFGAENVSSISQWNNVYAATSQNNGSQPTDKATVKSYHSFWGMDNNAQKMPLSYAAVVSKMSNKTKFENEKKNAQSKTIIVEQKKQLTEERTFLELLLSKPLRIGAIKKVFREYVNTGLKIIVINKYIILLRFNKAQCANQALSKKWTIGNLRPISQAMKVTKQYVERNY